MEPQAVHRSKRILSRTDNLLEVRDFVGEAARSFGFSEEEAANIILAVDEACTNIIKHAYQYATDKEIEVTIRQSKDSFEIRIFDNGKSFDSSAGFERAYWSSQAWRTRCVSDEKING
jgi:serine/threonine-protein kinase RsbW